MGQRHQTIELRKDLRCHDCWASILRAAMHDSVPDANYFRLAVFGSEPLSNCLECIEAVIHLFELLID